MTTSDSPLSSQPLRDRPSPSTLLLLLDLDTLFAATEHQRDPFIDVGRILLDVRERHNGPILSFAYSHRLFAVPELSASSASVEDLRRIRDQGLAMQKRYHYNMGLIRDWYHDDRVRTILSPYRSGEEELRRIIVSDGQAWISSVPSVQTLVVASDASTVIAVRQMAERIPRRTVKIIAVVPRDSDARALEGICDDVRLLRFPIASALNPLIRDLHQRQCAPAHAVDRAREDRDLHRCIARLLPVIRAVMSQEQRIDNLTYLRNHIVRHSKFSPLKRKISRQEVMTILQFLWGLGIVVRKTTDTETPLFLMNPLHPELARLLDGSF